MSDTQSVETVLIERLELFIRWRVLHSERPTADSKESLNSLRHLLKRSLEEYKVNILKSAGVVVNPID